MQPRWKFLAGDLADFVRRSDSSAARALTQSIGDGRSRRVAANIFWFQREVSLTVSSGGLCPPKTRATCLSTARLKGLKPITKMVTGDEQKVAKEEYEEMKAKNGRERRD